MFEPTPEETASYKELRPKPSVLKPLVLNMTSLQRYRFDENYDYGPPDKVEECIAPHLLVNEPVIKTKKKGRSRRSAAGVSK
jgi:hypothetical protein